MDSIQFIPNNQKKLNRFNTKKFKNSFLFSVTGLIIVCIIYVSILGFVHFSLVSQEIDKVSQDIALLDKDNNVYYPQGDLVQVVHNMNDVISQSYHIVPVMRLIESGYIPNVKVNSIAYTKSTKTISLSLTVSSIEEVSNQINAFKNLPVVSKADFASTSILGESNAVQFESLITLK